MLGSRVSLSISELPRCKFKLVLQVFGLFASLSVANKFSVGFGVFYKFFGIAVFYIWRYYGSSKRPSAEAVKQKHKQTNLNIEPSANRQV
jgi:hypothetical protein